jgi:hypothetical protein
VAPLGCCRNIGSLTAFFSVESYTSLAMNSVGLRDRPAALIMRAGLMAFALTMILRPDRVRANFDL